MKCERDQHDLRIIHIAYCIANDGDSSGRCTLDCGGGAPVRCYPEGVLERGSYRLRFDDDDFVFSVPSRLPLNRSERALCAVMWRGRKIPH
jgi:hypothetical protein